MQINEKDFNPIVVRICRDMFRYDSNEIVQTEGDSDRDCAERHPGCTEG